MKGWGSFFLIYFFLHRIRIVIGVNCLNTHSDDLDYITAVMLNFFLLLVKLIQRMCLCSFFAEQFWMFLIYMVVYSEMKLYNYYTWTQKELNRLKLRLEEYEKKNYVQRSRLKTLLRQIISKKTKKIFLIDFTPC